MKKIISILLSVLVLMSTFNMFGTTVFALSTSNASIAYNAYPYNVEGDSLAAQVQLWNNKVASGSIMVDATPYIISATNTKTTILYDSLYYDIKGGYMDFKVDLADRTSSFAVSFWAALKNCVILGSKDEGQTWYLIGDGDGKNYSLSYVKMPDHGNANTLAQCKKNIEWLLIGNPEKKLRLRIYTTDTSSAQLVNKINFEHVVITDNDTSSDLPTTVPDGYVVPKAYDFKIATSSGNIRYDTNVHNLEQEAEVAAQQAIWNAKIAKDPKILDANDYIVDSKHATSHILYDGLYLHIKGGHATYTVDFPDRTIDFKMESWAEYKNCVFLGSKDEGKTWYLVGDGTGLQLGLNTVTIPTQGNAASLAKIQKNIEWLLTGNPEKKIWFRVETVDGMGTAKMSSIKFHYTAITDQNTSLDYPNTVPDGYDIPQAYPVKAEEKLEGRDPSASFDFSEAFGHHMVLQQNQDVNVFGFGDSGKTVTVTLKKGDNIIETASSKVNKNGEWKVVLQPQKGSFDAYSLIASDGKTTQTLLDVKFGEVWVTGGQSNMELGVEETVERNTWKDKERDGNIRIFVQKSGNPTEISEARKEPSGEWFSTTDWGMVYYNSAISYYFAENLYAKLNVPIGIISTAVGDTSLVTWLDKDVVAQNAEFKAYLEQNNSSKDKTLFLARVAPFKGMKVAGMLWYQGERDVDRLPNVYVNGIPALVQSWSGIFGCENGELLPFISSQLAPYRYSTEESLPSANEKIAQGVAKLNANGGNGITIPIYDLPLTSSSHPIHPNTKQPVADRCADAAMGMVYDQLEIYSGPTLVSAKQQGKRIVLTFDNVGEGLKTRNGETLKDFRVIAEDDSTVSGTAAIKNKDTVEITLNSDVNIKSVYYAYATMNTTSNLYNANGYLALPFRTSVTRDPNYKDDTPVDYYLHASPYKCWLSDDVLSDEDLAAQQVLWDAAPKGDKLSDKITAANLVSSTYNYGTFWLTLRKDTDVANQLVFELDLPDDTTKFELLPGWGVYRNCTITASKDGGETWYVVGRILDELPSGKTVYTSSQLTASEIANTYAFLLADNPEKKLLLRYHADSPSCARGKVQICNIGYRTYNNTVETYTTPKAYTGDISDPAFDAAIAEDYPLVLTHTVVTDAAVEPTYTSTGLTEGSHCSACGEVLVAQQIIPAKEYVLGDATGNKTVDLLDLIAMKKALLENAEYSVVVDMNKDSLFNALDILGLKKILWERF